MNGLVAVTVYFAAAMLVHGARVATMASDGNWGGALGVLVGQLLFFYVVQAILYFGWRWLSGDRSRTLYTSRINYLSLALGLLSLAGQMNVAMRHGL